MKRLLPLFAFLLIPLAAHAQSASGPLTIHAGAPSGFCPSGSFYWQTDAAAGSNIWVCPMNEWLHVISGISDPGANGILKRTALNTTALAVAGSDFVIPSALDSKANTDLSNVSGSVAINNFPAMQPISASALPLPAGAATDATLLLIKAGTDKIPLSPSTDRTSAIAPFAFRLTDGAAFYKATTPADTQPVSIASVPSHPVTNTGTFAVQVTSAPSTPVTGPLTDAQLRANAVSVSGTFFQSIQPVSGPVTDAQLRTSPIITQEGSASRFSCFLQAVTVTTQCQTAPGAGLRNYVTGVVMSNQAATVQTLDVIYGTGTNCATSPIALTHKVQLGTNGTTTSPIVASLAFPTPLVPASVQAICVRPSAATAFGITITGYVAQ